MRKILFITFLLAYCALAFGQSSRRTKINEKYVVKEMTINSSLSEVPTHFENGQLYVYRNKPFYKFYNKYYDLFTVDVYKEEAKGRYKLLKGNLNTRFNEGPVSFDRKNNLAYVTRNIYTRRELRKNSLTVNPLEIDIYKEIHGEFKFIKKFTHNNKDYSVAHAFYSEASKRIYFSSNMDGGIGAADLYYCNIDSSGEYSTPINLGKNVNSRGDDMYTVVNNGILFFCSRGRHRNRSRKDLDIYYVTELGALRGEKPKHLDEPLNSKYDDFGITFIDNQSGYYATNSAYKQEYNHNIFYFDLGDPLFGPTEFNLFLEVDSIHKRNFARSKFKVFDNETNKELTKLLVNDGYIFEKVESNKTYTIKFVENSKFKDIVVGPFEKLNKSDVFKEQLLDIEPIIVQKDTVIPVKIDTVYAQTDTVNKYVESNLMDSISEIAKEVKEIKNLIINNKLVLNNVYFELNSSTLTEVSKYQMDKLVDYLKEYKDKRVAIEAYTDSRGSATYNLNLSKRRAKSVKTYILSQGISSIRIASVKGMGEANIINKCKEGVECSEELHKINRRVEFIFSN